MQIVRVPRDTWLKTNKYQSHRNTGVPPVFKLAHPTEIHSYFKCNNARMGRHLNALYKKQLNLVSNSRIFNLE